MLVALMLATVLGAPCAVARVICLDTDLDTRHWVEKHFALADVVILGNVVSAETPGKSEPDSSMEGASLEDRYRRLAGQSEQTVTLKPVKVWKGSPSDAVVVTNQALPPTHGFLLRQGETYLVFAYRQEEGGSYTISTVCGDTKRESDAADRIEVLNELEVRRQPSFEAMNQHPVWPFPLGKVFPDQPLTCEFRDQALVERTIRDPAGVPELFLTSTPSGFASYRLLPNIVHRTEDGTWVRTPIPAKSDGWTLTYAAEDGLHYLFMMEHIPESAAWETRVVISDDGGKRWRYGESLRKYLYMDAVRYLSMDESGVGTAVEYYDGNVGGYDQAGYYLFRTDDWGATWSEREYRKSFDVTGFVDLLDEWRPIQVALPGLAEADLEGFGPCP